MWMAVVVYLVIGVSGYLWLTRGFFSALVHLVCTVAAGAVALGVFEPLAYLILANSPDRGTGTFLRDAAWAIALAVPFAASLGILRAATNKLLPVNAQCGDVGDAVGGLVCGLASGVITAGFVMLSIGLLRVPSDFMGYEPATYTSQAAARGAVERSRGLLVGLTPRADLVTARLYERLSLTTLRTWEPLGRWYPDLADAVAANRLTFEGKSRNTLKPGEVRFLGWYTVGLDPKDAQFRGGAMANLLTDRWNPAGQGVIDLDGNPVTNGYIAGFQVEFRAGAKEKMGQVILGAGQARLVVESVTDNEWKTLHPCAVVSAMDVANLTPDQKPASARFRFDGNDVYVASVGGAAESVMWLEFAVPAGFRPIGLYVKQTRWAVPEGPPTKAYASPMERDAQIVALGGVLPGAEAESGVSSIAPEGIMVTNSMGFTLQRGSERGLEIKSDDRDNHWVLDGEAKFGKNEINNRTVDRKLRVDRLAVTPDTVVVKVVASGNSKASLLGESAVNADLNQPLYLVDSNGQRYAAVGFRYEDKQKVHLRYTVGSPLRSAQELVQAGVMPSRSKPDATLEIIFRPTFGAKIVAFQVGNTVVCQWDPPINLDQRQG
jgi:hypothetical protein